MLFALKPSRVVRCSAQQNLATRGRAGQAQFLSLCNLRRRQYSCRYIIARAASPEPLVAVDGDMVSLHYECRDEDGKMIDSTRERGEPLTLELGLGEIVGNPLVQALEQAVRSHAVGDQVNLKLQGGEYKRELVFTVPIDHPEIVRLEGRYKSQGGLAVDKVVELQNGEWAQVVEMRENEVVLDTNRMLAGLQRMVSVEILSIERPPPQGAAAEAAPSPSQDASPGSQEAA